MMLPLVFSLPVRNAFWPLSCREITWILVVPQKHGWKPHLAWCQIGQSVIGKDDCDVCLWRRAALVHSPRLLEVNCPYRGLLCLISHFQLKDAICLGDVPSEPVHPYWVHIGHTFFICACFSASLIVENAALIPATSSEDCWEADRSNEVLHRWSKPWP